jgi:hypothetical protein
MLSTRGTLVPAESWKVLILNGSDINQSAQGFVKKDFQSSALPTELSGH